MDRIEPRFEKLMNDIAKALDKGFNGPGPRTIGFVLAVFELDKLKDGRFNYISNSKREDVMILLKEAIAKFEGNAPEINKDIQ